MAARPSATPEPGTTTVAIVDSSIRSPGVASPGGTSAGMTATLAGGSAVDEPATGGDLHRGTTPASGRLALRGDLLDFGSDPAWGDVGSDAVRFRPDHWLLIV